MIFLLYCIIIIKFKIQLFHKNVMIYKLSFTIASSNYQNVEIIQINLKQKVYIWCKWAWYFGYAVKFIINTASNILRHEIGYYYLDPWWQNSNWR